MKTLFYKSRLARELKRLAKENAAEGKPLSILDDVVFKTMLSSNSDDSREALRSLLSACTRREVSKVQILNNDLLPAYFGGKAPRLDVHVTFNDGETAGLEMQTGKSDDNLRKRAIYYSSMLVSNQLPKGKPYKSIERVYQIFFLNFIMFPGSNKFPRRYFYQEELEHDRLSEVTEIIFYELPKLEHRLKEATEDKAEIKTLTGEEKWCIYMKYRHEARAGGLIKRLCHEEAGIMRAEKTVTKLTRQQRKYARSITEMKNRYDKYERAMEIQNEVQRIKEEMYAEAKATGHAEGHAAGHAKGHTAGHAEGHAAGHAEGHAAGQTVKAHEIARNMKETGLPPKEIARLTGLPLRTINSL